MKKSLKFGLTSALSALMLGLVAPAAYMLTTDAAENAVPEITTSTFEMRTGGSVRTQLPTGIRFTTYVNEEYYASLAEQDYSFGTLIIPKALLGEAELTHSVASVADVELKVWAESEVDNYMSYTAVLTDIPDTRYAEVLVARSYVRIGTQYTYATNPQERSIAQVAAKALASNAEDENGVMLNYVDTVATGVTLDKVDAIVKTGETLTLAATTAPAGYEVVWESSNSEIATVKDGTVKAVKEGEVTIIAKFGKKTAICVVTVKDTVASSYQLADVGTITLDSFGALTWDAVTTEQGNITADQYEVTVTDEGGNANVYTVSENAYKPYLLSGGTYTATVKAAHTKSWIDGSANASEEYKFVVTRYKDWSASEIDTTNGAFSTSENGVYATYNDQTGYAQIKSAGNYGLIVSNEGITLNMAKNPIIVMDTVAGNGTMYFKMSYDGSQEDGNKVYLMKDTQMGTYEEDRYIAIKANDPVEQGDLTDTVTNFKIYPGVSTADTYITVRGIYIVSVNEYVEPPVELLKLDAPANVTKKGAVISASAPANKIAEANITYTISVTGDGVNYTVSDATSLSVDLTQFALVSGETYQVSFMANGDAEGVYHSASEPTVVDVRYTETHNSGTDFTAAYINNRYAYREGDAKDFTMNENGISWVCAGSGNWVAFTYHIDMTGKRLTTDSVITVTLGDVTNDTKYLMGFYGASGTSPREILFENYVTSGGKYTISDIFTPLSGSFNGSYIIDNTLYYAFGMGGTNSSNRTITIKSIVLAEYSILPCDPMTETKEVTFDKSNATDKEIDYTFEKAATLKSVSIDGVTLTSDQYETTPHAITLKAATLEALVYGEYTVTLTDTNGFTLDVSLTITDTRTASYSAATGAISWLTVTGATSYEVEVSTLTDWTAETVVLKTLNTATAGKVASGNVYQVSADNLESGKYAVRVRGVLGEDSYSSWSAYVKFEVEKIVYWNAEKLATFTDGKNGGNHATASYDSNKDVAVVEDRYDNWGNVVSDDVNLNVDGNTFLTYVFGDLDSAYYTNIWKDGTQVNGSGDIKSNATRVVALSTVVGTGDMKLTLMLGATQGNGRAEYKSVNICKIVEYVGE
ncbi:MAG: Ig domain-containing protein [Clostridia bacterium]|nr:Ig domain-containing protein [Clostridia bacterium]